MSSPPPPAAVLEHQLGSAVSEEDLDGLPGIARAPAIPVQVAAACALPRLLDILRHTRGVCCSAASI